MTNDQRILDHIAKRRRGGSMTLQEKKMDENEMDYPEQKYEID